MKYRMLIAGLIGLLITAFGGVVLAQPEHDRPMDHHRLGRMLDLSEEQRAKMMDMHLQLKKEMLPLKAELKQLRAELKLALTSDSYDEGKVQKLLDKMASLRKEMALKRIRNQRAVRDMLTPEQRKKFDMFILSGHGKRGHRPGFRGGPRPPHPPERPRR
ncbi:MAG: periplasmic heavy metal sensor [Calditrichaeota bacterium]|nr:MAG: periplasmic heavy metal sensor [Calditrichota bacterium]